jgi:protein associated with RNAse G/E
MQTGDPIQVKAYKSDGTCYRWWPAIVEAMADDVIITISPIGKRVEDIHGSWISEVAIRTFYWLNKPYSLLEVYAPDGTLREIYVNINSLVQIESAQFSYVDYELDVVLQPPNAAFIVDQDEFAEAAIKYGYTDEFQKFCYQAATEAITLANGWVAKGMPNFPS